MRRLNLVAMVLTCLWCLTSTAALAQPPALQASWECLPENTAGAVRIPNGRAILESFKKTKFGSVLLSEQRSSQVQEMLADYQAWSSWVKELKEYGLEPNDLLSCLQGETGFAAVLETLDDEPYLVGLGWFDAGDERAGRLQDAIAIAIENQEDADHPIQRTDMEIEDVEVMVLALPTVAQVFGDDAFELPDNLGELDEDERRKAIRAAHREAAKSEETQVKHTHLLAASLQGRMLFALTFAPSEKSGADDAIELLSATFAQFIASHTDEPGAFVSRIEATPGVADTLPQSGDVFFEAFGDMHPFVDLLQKYTEENEVAVKNLVNTLGIGQLGIVAARASLDESLLTTGVFIEAAMPREGLLTIFDQPELDPFPPAWVPASVMEFGHLSLDLGKLYAQIKQIATASAGEMAQMTFQQVETTVKQAVDADLMTVLSSLGHRHTVISLEPRMREVQVEGESMNVLSERAGMVWRVQDEELWKRIMQAGQAYAAIAGGMVTFEKAQGYEGFRLKSDEMEGGLFLGNGYLVLGMGEEVLDQMLALLNKPPTGNDALRNSDKFRHATSLLRGEPGQSFEFADDDQYAGFLGQMVEPFLEQPELMGVLLAQQGADPKSADKIADGVRALMPTQDELKDIFGVSVGYRRATDRGVEIKSVTELPR